MSSQFEKRSSLEDFMTEETTETTAPIPTVQIPEADWTRLQQTIKQLESLAVLESTERMMISMDGGKYLSAMKKASEAQTESAAKAIRTIAENAEERVGKVSEKASRAIERRAIRDEFLWWLRLLLMALPTVLVLCLAVYLGWLRLLP